jgi:LysM repeat protein
VHIVQPGETLYRISVRYNTTVAAIAGANNITDPTTIYVGQQLAIPGPDAEPTTKSTGATTYTIQPGDNLYRIALKFGLTYQQLAAYNGITNPNSIYVGQVLRIPPR